jgi:hypothetical protein
VTGATSYQIEEAVNGSFVQIGSVSGSTTSFSVSGLSANTTYEFNLVPVNAAGATWGTGQLATTLQASTNTNSNNNYNISPELALLYELYLEQYLNGGLSEQAAQEAAQELYNAGQAAGNLFV